MGRIPNLARQERAISTTSIIKFLYFNDTLLGVIQILFKSYQRYIRPTSGSSLPQKFVVPVPETKLALKPSP